MNASQPFGRRGRPPNSAGSSLSAPRLSQSRTSLGALPPELLATILHPQEAKDAAERSKVHKVAWSFRAAVLAGLVAGLLSAAVKATSVLDLGGILGQIPLGEAKVPFAVALAAAGLWGGARASALALLVAHTLLSRIGQTSYFFYAAASGGASLACGLIAAVLGFADYQAAVADTAVGAAAGFFYRLFAATERNPPQVSSLDR
jgi:hypothetical protein